MRSHAALISAFIPGRAAGLSTVPGPFVKALSDIRTVLVEAAPLCADATPQVALPGATRVPMAPHP